MPVGSFRTNGFGLFDLIGNVWEWTSDYYTPRHLRLSDRPVDAGKRQNLLARASADEAFPSTPRRVLKGGSFLCSPEYCLRFRPAARSPQSEDTGMSHVGLSCTRDARLLVPQRAIVVEDCDAIGHRYGIRTMDNGVYERLDRLARARFTP